MTGTVSVLHCLWGGGVGGAERSVSQLVGEQLRDPDLEPAIMFARGEGPYWEAAHSLGCPVIDLGLPHGHAVGQLGRIAEAMGDHDIHHFHSAEPLWMLASARLPAPRRVYTHRGGTTRYSAGKRIRHRLTATLLRRRFHGLTGNTRHAASCAASLYRLPAARFTTIYNGVDFGALRPRRPRERVRAELGIGPDDFVLGTTANLKRWKRIERVIATVAELGDRRTVALIVGDGPDRERLEAEAERLGVVERVRFAGRQDHVADQLGAMSAFCLPSTGLESFGNAAVEAMALGLPTIVFADGGGIVEHIEPGRTGFVVGDPAELTAVVSRLRREPELGAEIGERASAEVRRRYTLERSAAAYKQLYLSSLGTPAGAPASRPAAAR